MKKYVLSDELLDKYTEEIQKELSVLQKAVYKADPDPDIEIKIRQRIRTLNEYKKFISHHINTLNAMLGIAVLNRDIQKGQVTGNEKKGY